VPCLSCVSCLSCVRAEKQLRNDLNSGTPASTRVRKPASSVLKEFQVTTTGFGQLVDERDDVLGEPVRQPPERTRQPDNDHVDVLVGTDRGRTPACGPRSGFVTRNCAPLSTGLATVR
jgi:hypothetical protein